MHLANGESFDPELRRNLPFFMLYLAITSWAHIRRDIRRAKPAKVFNPSTKTPKSSWRGHDRIRPVKTVNTIKAVVLICTEARSWWWQRKLRPFIKVKIVIRRCIRRLPSPTLKLVRKVMAQIALDFLSPHDNLIIWQFGNSIWGSSVVARFDFCRLSAISSVRVVIFVFLY